MTRAVLFAVGLLALIAGVLALVLSQRSRAALREAQAMELEAVERAQAAAGRAAGDRIADLGAQLDAFHEAASRADLEAYIGALDPDGLFAGTDASEAWTTAEFRGYCEPYFAEGRGWTYRAAERRIDPLGPGSAAFYEDLVSEKYGVMRGSGAARHDGERWRIVQYVMSFPVPNEVAPDLLELIEAAAADGE